MDEQEATRCCGRRLVRGAGDAVKVQAAQLRREAAPADNRRAQRETEHALQRMVEAVEALQGP